jgi:hypothetical protein
LSLAREEKEKDEAKEEEKDEEKSGVTERHFPRRLRA